MPFDGIFYLGGEQVFNLLKIMNEITNEILYVDETLMDVFKLSNSEHLKFELFLNNRKFI